MAPHSSAAAAAPSGSARPAAPAAAAVPPQQQADQQQGGGYAAWARDFAWRSESHGRTSCSCHSCHSPACALRCTLHTVLTGLHPTPQRGLPWTAPSHGCLALMRASTSGQSTATTHSRRRCVEWLQLANGKDADGRRPAAALRDATGVLSPGRPSTPPPLLPYTPQIALRARACDGELAAVGPHSAPGSSVMVADGENPRC